MKKVNRLFLVLLLTLLSYVGFSQIENCFPEKQLRLVYDNTGTLSGDQIAQLETTLVNFSNETSNQIVVVIVADLCGYDKADYAIELGDRWGVGQAKEDNGIVFLVKPKTSSSRGEVFIAVGRGLEGAITDADAFVIIDEEVIPRFKQNDYYGGLTAGLDVLIPLAKGEFSISDYKNANKKKKNGIFFGIFFIVFGIIGLVFFVKYRQAKKYAALNNVDFWTAWMLLNQMQRTHHGSRGFWGGYGGGGGFGGGGGGGGGFGGFGGGGFGGGGAGGSW
ncbi:MAG: TPM domain-containing protein [Flavobacteriales bacterium]|jgi:uncharacterized protein